MTLVLYDVENIKTSRTSISTKESFKIDLIKLKNEIEKYVDDICIHTAFIPVVNDGVKKLVKVLNINEINTILKYTREKKSTYKGMEYKYKDNDMDAKIASYAAIYYNMFDTIVLVSGDGDLFHVMEIAKEANKRTVVVGWKSNMSSKYKKRYEVLYLDDMDVKIEN